MNLKCISTLITVYAPGMGDYQSNISYLITKDNVYPLSTDREGYYTINNHQLPTYLFELTTDPITPVPIVDTIAIQKKLIAERNEQIRQDNIQDAMDQYYNPEKFHAKQRRKQDTINAISRHFVQGIPYGD